MSPTYGIRYFDVLTGYLLAVGTYEQAVSHSRDAACDTWVVPVDDDGERSGAWIAHHEPRYNGPLLVYRPQPAIEPRGAKQGGQPRQVGRRTINSLLVLDSTRIRPRNRHVCAALERRGWLGKSGITFEGKRAAADFRARGAELAGASS